MSMGSPESTPHPAIATPEAASAGPGPAKAAASSADGLENFVQSIRGALAAIKYRASCHILSHLRLMKLGFAVLRVVRPAMIVGNTLVVTKASDVREVLERFDDFVLGEVIEPGMPWGSFLMTVDWREQHQRERQMLQSMVSPATDLSTIRAIAADVCRSRIAGAAKTGKIDVVAELSDPVMVRIFADYIGVTPLAGDDGRMARAMRRLAGIIMVNPPSGSQAWRDSRNDMEDLTRQLLAQLAAGRSNAGGGPATPPKTLLGRLKRRHGQSPRPEWFDDDWIRRYLTGLVATGGATVIRGVTHAVDQLLERPDALRRAAALSSQLDELEARAHASTPIAVREAQLAAAREPLRLCIYEALRFRPMLPLLVRDCPRDTIIANGTPRARRVPAGTRVIAPPLAAMFDAEAFPNPAAFEERPIDSYFHFGFGPRRCFGKYIADIAMLEIVRALMRLPGLARAGGSKGQVAYDGPAPCSLVVTFDAYDPGGVQ